MRTVPRDSGRSWHTDIVKPGERMDGRSRHVGRQRREMELHVGAVERGIGAREHAALVDADRHRAPFASST